MMSANQTKTRPDGLLGVDLGAGSLKATLVGLDGKVVAEASSPVSTHAPFQGWSEQDPQDWWDAACAAIRQILETANVRPERIAAMSFSAGAHTSVLVDRAGSVIRPAIMWNDQRSWREAGQLAQTHGSRLFEITGNRPTATWTLPQFAWLKANEPDCADRVARVYFAKDWLRSRFTGDWVSDRIDAEGAMLFDRKRGVWSDEICSLIDWPVSTLPDIRPLTSVVGMVTKAAAAACGLAEGTPVVCGTSDTAIETFAAGMTDSRIGVVKLATAATVAVLTETPATAAGIITYSHVIPDHFYAILGTNSCASAHRWLRNTMFSHLPGDQAYGSMDLLAQGVSYGSEGLYFHPYLNGERSPHWDPLLRASFVGASFAHGPGHFARALYEGVAYSIRDCYEVLRHAGLGFSRAHITGGGARSALWRQILADVLDVEIAMPANCDASYGAALVAGIGIGAFENERDAAKHIEIVSVSKPNAKAADIYSSGFEHYRHIQSSLAPVHHAIAAHGNPT